MEILILVTFIIILILHQIGKRRIKIKGICQDKFWICLKGKTKKATHQWNQMIKFKFKFINRQAPAITGLESMEGSFMKLITIEIWLYLDCLICTELTDNNKIESNR